MQPGSTKVGWTDNKWSH